MKNGVKTVIAVGITVVVVAAGILIFGDSLESPKIQEKRTNVIVVMTDDLDVVSMKTLLDNNLMPNLKKFIIDRGTDFTNSFVTKSVTNRRENFQSIFCVKGQRR